MTVNTKASAPATDAERPVAASAQPLIHYAGVPPRSGGSGSRGAGAAVAAAFWLLSFGARGSAAQPTLDNCTQPNTSTGGGFSVNGYIQDSPCSPEGTNSVAVAGKQHLFACGTKGAVLCDGDGSGPRAANCSNVRMLGCSTAQGITDVAFTRGADAVWAACIDFVTRCSWDAAAGTASGCAPVTGAECPGNGEERGVAFSGSALVLGCSSLVFTAAEAGVCICPLAAGGAALIGICVKSGEDPCGTAYQLTFKSMPLSLSAAGGISVGCGVDGASYCTTFSTRAGPRGCAAPSSPSPCQQGAGTQGFAELPSGRTMVSCGSDGIWLCGGPASPTAAPSAHPSTAPGTPTSDPSQQPSQAPSLPPSQSPFFLPSAGPTPQPSRRPTVSPTLSPRRAPSTAPSRSPTAGPWPSPSRGPSSSSPTRGPSWPAPADSPTRRPSAVPRGSPSDTPSAAPSAGPAAAPTQPPTKAPKAMPTPSPSQPVAVPSPAPSSLPVSAPSAAPSTTPTGECESSPSGSPCSLGNGSATCIAGHCVDRCAQITCSTPDDCHLPGLCDPATGVCTDPAQPDGHTCNDGNQGTVDDACLSGVCRGAAQCAGVSCTPCDARCARAQCDSASGKCMEQPSADGATCNDGDALTRDDKCADGLCIGDRDRCAGTVCPPASQCHLAGTCDPNTGLCSEPQAPNASACNDGNAATINDTCSGGVCVGVLPCGNATCEASQAGLVDPRCHWPQCTRDRAACAPPSVRPDGAPCADGRVLSAGDKCALGTCVGEPDLCAGVQCFPHSPCFGMGRCDPRTGECVDLALADGVSCNDGDAATNGDSCAAGVCSGSLECRTPAASWNCTSPPSACHRSACGTSGCILRMRDCVPCNDGDPGTAGDVCRGGACVGANVSSTRLPPIAGTATFDAPSGVSFSAAALASGLVLEMVIVLAGDKVANLGNGTALQVGLRGDTEAAVLFSGTRKAVAEAASARVLSPERVLLSIRSSEALVPARVETVHVTIRSGVTASGLEPVGYTNFKLLPKEQPITGALRETPPAAAGVGSLALKLRQCIDDQEPEDTLDRVTSPTGLKFGGGAMAAYNGAMVANAAILTIFTVACGGLYIYLTKQVNGQIQQGRAVHISRSRRLAFARFGSFVYPLTFLYPSSAFTAAQVLMYGEGFYRALSGVVFALCAVFPLFVIHAARKVHTFAAVVPISQSQSRLEWFLSGSESWEEVGRSSSHQVYRLFYEGYRFRDRHLLALDLFLNLALAILQAIRAQSEQQCALIGYSVLGLMVLYSLYVTVRCSVISPYERLCTLAVLWGEVACKVLLNSAGYGHTEDHWAVAAANFLTKVVYAILITQAIVAFCFFYLAEYGYWVANPGGGQGITGRCRRVAHFSAFWFAFRGLAAAMFGGEMNTAASESKAAPEELEDAPSARESPEQGDYSLMRPADDSCSRSGPCRSPPTPVLRLGFRALPTATSAAPLEVTMEMGREAAAAGVSLEQLAVAQIPEDALPPAGAGWGAALRAARSHACGLRASSSPAERGAAKGAHSAAVAAVDAERGAAGARELSAADALLRATAAALRGYGCIDAAVAPGTGSGTAVVFSKRGLSSPLSGLALSPLSVSSASSLLPPAARPARPAAAGSGVSSPAPRGAPLSPIADASVPSQPSTALPGPPPGAPLLPPAARSGLLPLRRSQRVDFPLKQPPPL